MIIQCEQCRTKFKLDDSKVADKSIKVRCARCRNVFSVAGSQSVPEGTASFEQTAPVFQIEEDLRIIAVPVPDSTIGFKPDMEPEEYSADNNSSSLNSFSFAADNEQATPDPPPSAKNDFDFSLPPVENPATPSNIEFGGLDFSGDDMFGDVVSMPPEEAASDSMTFDAGMPGSADSMGVESSAAGQNASSETQKPAAENPFSLDEIDFGDELTSVTVQQVNPEELKPGQDLLFAPLAATEVKPVPVSSADTPKKTATPPVQEEFPPLPISSRRKESSRLSGILVLMGLIIAGLAAYYYWGYVTPTEDKGKITGETGRITVRSVEASFIKNQQTGDLLVIRGEAVNEYNKPRAAIQIKGIVFGADGKEVSSKSAFCGNLLSREQLATMTMDKIEAAMANQFGDSLANMEVAPGAAIPFVVVIPKPPAGATDYGVELVGSTVATGKNK
jgi:predicted Zn finger-like uncharacterized protein